MDAAARIRETKRGTDLTGANGAGDIWNRIREQEAYEHMMRARYDEYGDPLIVMKVPEFEFSSSEVGPRWTRCGATKP